MVVGVLLPLGPSGHAIALALLSLSAIIAAAAGLVLNDPPRRVGWVLVLGGFTGWVLGDVVSSVERLAFDLETLPTPSNGFDLAGYALVMAGLISIIVTHRNLAHRDIMLDVAIVATGSAMLLGALMVLPVLGNSRVSSLDKATVVAYVVADVMLLTGVSQLWAMPCIRSRSYTLLPRAPKTFGTWRRCAILGVRYAQCYLLGRPSRDWGPRAVKLPFPRREDTQGAGRLMSTTGGTATSIRRQGAQ